MFRLADRLPKAELHLHIEGTLEPEMMFALAARNGLSLPYRSVGEVREAYVFGNLQDFLDIYFAGCAVLQSEQDFYDLTHAYLLRAAKDHVRHAEIFFDPQTHTDRGVAFSDVVGGISRALDDFKSTISSHLIMCFLRHLDEEAAIKTLEAALPYKELIEAVGLDSSEKNNPPRKFARVFQLARDAGFRCVAHAGEEGPPDYIWQALDILQVERVDHGIRCLEDPILVQRLAAEQVPLTVCPLSNVRLQVFKRLEDHNLKHLLDQNLCVTINSDDPAYFGGYVGDNYAAVSQSLQLSDEDLIKLSRNGFRASFLPDEKKRRYEAEVDVVAQAMKASIPE